MKEFQIGLIERNRGLLESLSSWYRVFLKLYTRCINSVEGL